MSPSFDTYAAVSALCDAGLAEEHATAIVRTVRDASIDRGDLATKTDLAQFATKADLATFATKADLAPFALKSDLAQFATKSDLKAAVADLEARLTWRMVGLAAVIIAAVKLIPGLD